ncbi:MAG TPA: DUF4186 domain-containing protein [Methylophilaceae bacterium]|jgi:hypothetical protein
MRELDELFQALEKSSFRSSFRLNRKEQEYLRSKGLSLILEHARDFVTGRLAPAVISNDGKQTPFHGHPVFVAQHATACCCRGCLQKWHRIPAGRILTQDEQDYILDVLQHWFKLKVPPSLFDQHQT